MRVCALAGVETGLNLDLMIDAGVDISQHLGRPTASKVARALLGRRAAKAAKEAKEAAKAAASLKDSTSSNNSTTATATPSTTAADCSIPSPSIHARPRATANTAGAAVSSVDHNGGVPGADVRTASQQH